MDDNQKKRLLELVEFTECGDALTKVLEIRAQRKTLYANNWHAMKDWELLALLKNKLSRLEYFVIEKRDEKLYENRLDTLMDIINYSFFMVENEQSGRR